MNITTDLLLKFCDTTGDKPHLDHYFCQDGFIYATNGKIAIRCSFSEHLHLHFQNKPDMSIFEWNQIDVEDFKPLPIVKSTGVHPCGYCRGTGWQVCGKCECKHCQGVGKSKHFNQNQGTRIGENLLWDYYLDKMSILENCEVSISGKRNHPVLFRFSGGEGVFMPMRRKD